MKKYKTIFNHKPEALIVYSFLLASIIGTILLKLPISTVSKPLSWIDALFTSTSAVCVTGLSVIDIGKELSFFGQIVLLSLIQIGGLGIMTFSLLFLIFLGKKISLSSQLSVPNLAQEINLQNIKYSLSFIITMALTIEMCGAIILFLNLKNSHPIPYAIYSAIFHSISAFCNAGFSLYSENLVKFYDNTYILVTFMCLIVLGGLGFIVIYEIFNICTSKKLKLRKWNLSLHTKIALIGTLSLIFFGGGGIWLLENKHFFRNMPFGIQILNAFFLSITSRTAGFNSTDTGSLSNATLFLVTVLMFIGACPGSTAGGIKIHTFFTLVAHIRNKLKGLAMTSIFKRKIPEDAVDRSLTIFISATLLILIATFLLQVSEHVSGEALSSISEKNTFLDTLFETVSAFGTVGLSTGTTPFLTPKGKLILIWLMFIGRVGPLTLGLALQLRYKQKITYEYPQEEIVVN